MGRDVELQNTHMVLFKSPRDVLQVNTLSQQLGLGYQLKKWYQDATSVPYGHLLIDLTPKTVNSPSFCSNSGSVPTKIYLPAKIEANFLDDDYTIRLYSRNFPKTSKTTHSQLSETFHPFSERVFSEPFRGKIRDLRKQDVVKYRRKNSELTQKNSSTHKKNYFKLN